MKDLMDLTVTQTLNDSIRTLDPKEESAIVGGDVDAGTGLGLVYAFVVAGAVFSAPVFLAAAVGLAIFMAGHPTIRM